MLILNNAYNILGLPIDADDKLINKRYKEILNLLKIDEVPLYDNDLQKCDYSELRTVQSVDKAYANLTNLSKKLKEQFFWFDFHSGEMGKDFVHIINDKDGLWKKEFIGSRKLSDAKNKLFGEILLLEYYGTLRKKHKTGVNYSDLMTELKSLISNEKFWTEFVKIRSLYAGIEVRQDIIDGLRNSIPGLLAENFFDVSEYISDSKLYSTFVAVFNVHAKELDDNESVSESIKEVEQILDEIENLNLKDDIDEIIDKINTSSALIEKLNSLGLGENMRITTIKDHFSGTIRTLSIDLYNKYEDIDNALNFIEEAKKVAHSKSLIEKINGDIIQLEKNVEVIASNSHFHQCWFCKRNPKKDGCELGVEIYKITNDRRFLGRGRVEYLKNILKIPRCQECRDLEKSILSKSWYIGFVISFIFFGFITLSYPEDWTVIGFLFAGGIGWIILSPVIGHIWCLQKRVRGNFDEYPFWKELQKDGWRLGSNP